MTTEVAGPSSILPSEAKNLRACLLCSLVKTTKQFRKDGCDNCEEFLELKGSGERVEVCTSPNFDGMIGMFEPSQSWVARFQHISKFHKGLYAMRISGQLPEEEIRNLADRGVQYIPRDGSDLS